MKFKKLFEKAQSKNDAKKLGYSLLDFTPDKINDLRNWLSILKTSGKAPRGMKNEFNDIQFLVRQVSGSSDLPVHLTKHFEPSSLNISNIKNTLSRYNKKEIDSIVDKMFLSEGESDELILNGIKYKNESNLNFKKFKENSEFIASELKKLKGYHKKALDGDVTIKFIRKSEIKSKAKYKREFDEIWIRGDSILKGDDYASLIYIVVHELGHRFEERIGDKNIFGSNWYTTKYSRVDSIAGNEMFAELFALSHWESKYKEFKEQIDNFKELMK